MGILCNTKMKIFKIIPFFTALVLLLVSCNNKTEKNHSGGVIAVDSRGKTVQLEKFAERAVVLFAPMVDQLYMLQAGQQIIGIPEQLYLTPSTYSALSQLDQRIENKTLATPTFGGRSANLESVVGLKPDLAVVYEVDTETISQLEELGVPVFTVSSKGEASIFNELKEVSKLFGKGDRADKLIQYVKGELMKMRPEPKAVKKKVYYAWSKGRIFSTSGKGSLMDLAIESAGAQNACPLEMEAPNIGAELIYQWNPDLIILWNSEPNDVYKLKELAALPAVINKQVFELKPTFNFDPHTLKFLLFAKQLHHWCYPEKGYDPNNDIKNSLTVLYGQEINQ